MPFRKFPRLALALVAVITANGAAAWAADGQEFVLAGDDGYGVADCMRPGMECGRVMADAWCEAHGHGHAAAFGLSDDVTGSTKISVAHAATTEPSAVVIRCGD
jgi:hypothetical protein